MYLQFFHHQKMYFEHRIYKIIRKNKWNHKSRAGIPNMGDQWRWTFYSDSREISKTKESVTLTLKSIKHLFNNLNFEMIPS